MSVLIESTPELKKTARKTVSAHKLNHRKVSGEVRESIKKGSVVRRTKKNLNNQNFRHSLHEVSTVNTDLNDGVTKQAPHPERVRLRRSRSFHVAEDHGQTKISQRDRTEILKQYVANKFEIDVDNLETYTNNINTTKYDPLDGKFSIHEAIEKTNIKDLAIYLLKNENINIEQTNTEGQTPLQFSVSLELHDVVRLLITFGATVNTKDNYGETALRYAVDNGDFEMASLLISNGANAAVVQNGF